MGPSHAQGCRAGVQSAGSAAGRGHWEVTKHPGHKARVGSADSELEPWGPGISSARGHCTWSSDSQQGWIRPLPTARDIWQCQRQFLWLQHRKEELLASSEQQPGCCWTVYNLRGSPTVGLYPKVSVLGLRNLGERRAHEWGWVSTAGGLPST